MSNEISVTTLLFNLERQWTESVLPVYSAIRRGFPSLEWVLIIQSVLCNFAVIRVLPFLNNPKDLDPSYRMDLDFWDCFGRKKTLSYKRRNTVSGLSYGFVPLKLVSKWNLVYCYTNTSKRVSILVLKSHLKDWRSRGSNQQPLDL